MVLEQFFCVKTFLIIKNNDILPNETLLNSFLTDPNSGPSDDWAKGVAGIPYSYTIELRDQGPVYGFLLPPKYKTQINLIIIIHSSKSHFEF